MGKDGLSLLFGFSFGAIRHRIFDDLYCCVCCLVGVGVSKYKRKIAKSHMVFLTADSVPIVLFYDRLASRWDSTSTNQILTPTTLISSSIPEAFSSIGM